MGRDHDAAYSGFASPRRRQLAQLNLNFTVLVSSQEEKVDGEQDPVLLAERLAWQKPGGCYRVT